MDGDTKRGQALLDEAEHRESFFKQHGTTVQMGYDDQNRPIFTTTTGGAGQQTKPTVGFQTKSQIALTKYANATQLIAGLSKSLRPEDVGVKGVAGEWIVDRGLAQFYPGIANKDRIENRTALAMLRESLLREVSDDTRFSNLDRQEISRILPSDGVFESYEDAMTRMGRVRQIIADRSKIYAERMGEPVPEFAMTPDDIQARYNKQLDAIQTEFKANRITAEQANAEAKAAYERSIETLRRYH
jgi:hypothetical protein